MYLFNYWMPTVLTLSGLTPETAVFYASMFSLGGISRTLLLGPLIDSFGAPRVLACSFASGVVFILMIGLYNLPAPYIMLPILGAGAAMIGSQLGANAMAAGLYPARIRSTGVGWALGIGRLGGIAGPAIGGFTAGVRPAAEADFPVRLRPRADRRVGHHPADGEGRAKRQRRRRDPGGVV